jgi:hypothetical protein
MYTLTIKDGESLFGTLHINEKINSITIALRYNLKPLTVWSLFGCSRNVARVLVVTVDTGSLRDYEFHIPEKSAEECITNFLHQVDEIFYFDDMPGLVQENEMKD